MVTTYQCVKSKFVNGQNILHAVQSMLKVGHVTWNQNCLD